MTNAQNTGLSSKPHRNQYDQRNTLLQFYPEAHTVTIRAWLRYM